MATSLQKASPPETSKPSPRYIFWGGVLVFLGALCFSSKAIFVKLAYQYEVDSISLLALRMLFSLPFFLAVAWQQSRSKKVKLSSKDWLKILSLGMLGYYLASLLDFLGLQYISASLERLILFAYPTVVLLISAFFFGKSIQKVQVIALLLTYLGISLAVWGDFQLQGDAQMLAGAALVFASAIVYAVYLVGVGELVPKLGSLRFNALAMSSACGGVLLHSFISNGLHLGGLAIEVYYFSLGMALIATVLASFLLSEGIGRIGASNGAIISSIGPISTIILAAIFLGEQINFLQILGTGLVLMGVLSLSLRNKK